MKRFWLVIFLVSIVTGCSSPLKLDSVPVEDRTASNAIGLGPLASAVPAVRSTVAPVNLGAATSGVALLAPGRTVYFDYDSFSIRPEFQSIIEANAKSINSDKTKKVAIEGHTDERGGREYNLALGQKRADAVRRALVLLGVAESQMEAVSFGKEKPAMLGSAETAMEKNRRAEISIR